MMMNSVRPLSPRTNPRSCRQAIGPAPRHHGGVGNEKRAFAPADQRRGHAAATHELKTVVVSFARIGRCFEKCGIQ